jgi:hypothetical protein
VTITGIVRAVHLGFSLAHCTYFSFHIELDRSAFTMISFASCNQIGIANVRHLPSHQCMRLTLSAYSQSVGELSDKKRAPLCFICAGSSRISLYTRSMCHSILQGPILTFDDCMWHGRPTPSTHRIFSNWYDLAVSPKFLRAVARGRQSDTIVHLTGPLWRCSST